MYGRSLINSGRARNLFPLSKEDRVKVVVPFGNTKEESEGIEARLDEDASADGGLDEDAERSVEVDADAE